MESPLFAWSGSPVKTGSLKNLGFFFEGGECVVDS